MAQNNGDNGDTDLNYFATRLAPELINRLKLEALRRDEPIQTIVAEALDRFLPKSFVLSGTRLEGRR